MNFINPRINLPPTTNPPTQVTAVTRRPIEPTKHRLLCVDDEVANLDALERLFRKKYTVLRSQSGEDALKILGQLAASDDSKFSPVTVIISDQRMPGLSGVEFLEQSMELSPQSVRILLTGYADIEAVIAAINSGQVYRYVSKPWDPVDLLNAVDRAVEKYELTTELQIRNTELAEAIGELQTLDSAKNQFMFLVNHELKTPLTALKSFVELLKETRLTAEQKKYLHRIEGGTERLNLLIHEVLELVSAETGHTSVHWQRIDLVPFVHQFVASLETAQADSQHVSHQNPIQLQVEPALFYGDPLIITKILKRLVDNARKFSEPIEMRSDSAPSGPQNSPVVSLRAGPHHLTHVEFRLSNFARPIDPRALKLLSRPFYIDEDLMHHSHGLGLGLSVAQALLRIHQSHLEIENRQGRVEVSFKVPLPPVVGD